MLQEALGALKGSRKLAALALCTLAALLTFAGSAVAIKVLPPSTHGHVVTIASVTLATIAGMFGAFVTGNAAEHKHKSGGGVESAPAPSPGAIEPEP